MRAWLNSCTRKILEIEGRNGKFEEFYPYMAGDRMLKGIKSGDVDDICFSVGQSVGLMHDADGGSLRCKSLSPVVRSR